MAREGERFFFIDGFCQNFAYKAAFYANTMAVIFFSQIFLLQKKTHWSLPFIATAILPKVLAQSFSLSTFCNRNNQKKKKKKTFVFVFFSVWQYIFRGNFLLEEREEAAN